MKSVFLKAAVFSLIALPAFAQEVAPPAGPDAPPAANAAVAHHDHKVARKVARHGHMKKAAVADHAADAAASDASAPH